MHLYPSSNVAIVGSPVSEENDTVTDTSHRAAAAISKKSKSENTSTDCSHITEKPPFTALQEGNWLIPKVEKTPADAVLIQTPRELLSGIAKPKKPYGGEYKPINGIQSTNHTSRKYGKGKRKLLFSSVTNPNANRHASDRVLKSDDESNLNSEYHVKRRKIELSEETLLGGDGFMTNRTDNPTVGRWSGYLAETSYNATLNSPSSDFTMGKAAEFKKVEDNFNPKRNNWTKRKPSNGGHYPGHPSTASSLIASSSINGTKNSPILLKDDSKLLDKFIDRTLSSPSKFKTIHSVDETSQEPLTRFYTPKRSRKETSGDTIPSEDYISFAASRSSPVPAVAGEKSEVVEDERTRLGIKKYCNGVDELHGDCNITPSQARVKDHSSKQTSSCSSSIVVLEKPSREDNLLTKIKRKQKSSEPVNSLAEDVWPLRVYRTDSGDYLNVFLIFDEKNKHFEIKLHEEKVGKEIIDRSRINRIRCSGAGTKVVIDGPRKKNLATTHAFDFEQNEHCKQFIKKVEDIGISTSNAIQRKETLDLDKIFDDVAKKRQERESRRLPNVKRAEQDLISGESFPKANKRRSSVSCPDSESKRLRSDNVLESEIDSRNTPQRRSVRYLRKTHNGEGFASNKPSSKPEDLEKKTAQKHDTQKLESWPEPIIYPSTGTNRTSVEFEDVFRLEDGEFLNDNIISFYLRYLYEYSGQNKDKVYIFSTYFFSRLTSGAKRDIDYEAVEKWTAKVNIFNYEYLVVPVNHSLHWYLVIIYNSLYKERATQTDQSEDSSAAADSKAMWPSKDKVESTVKGISARKQEHSTSGIRTDFHRLALDEPASAFNAESLKESREMLLSDRLDGFNVSKNSISKYFTKPNISENSDGRLRPLHDNGKQLKEESSKAVSKENKARFFLISLDSFGESRPLVLRALKLYLIQEAKSKHKLELELDQKTFKGATAKGIPLQLNGCDCGVYLLNYVEKFMQNPQHFMEKLINKEMSIKEDWPEISTQQMRKKIQEKLFEVQKAQENRRQQRLTAKREGNEKRSVKPSNFDEEKLKHGNQLQNSDSPELIHAKNSIRSDGNDSKKHKVGRSLDSKVSEMVSEITSRPLKAEQLNTCSAANSKASSKKQDTSIHKLDPSVDFFQGVRAAGAE